MIIDPQVENYILNLHKRPPVLKDMEKFGKSINFPILGPMVGSMLLQYTMVMRAKRILELGSGFGYSGLWFAMGLPEDGRVYCTDYSAKNKEMAEGYFNRANLNHKLQFNVGDGLELMDRVDGGFDIILNDMQKTQYPSAFEKMLGKLRPGGLLISDNVLWRGKVVEQSEDETVSAIREFNRLIFESDRVVSTILPVRDGVAVCVKL